MKYTLLLLLITTYFSSCDNSCTKTFDGDEDNKLLSRVNYYENCEDTSKYLHEAYFPNNQLAHSVPIIDNERNGFYIEFNQEGDTLRKGEFLNGERNGLWVITATSTYIEKSYESGILQGPTYELHDNGTQVTGQYANGKEDGEWTWSHSNNNVSEIKNYKGGELKGQGRFFYENGKTQVSTEYINDSTVINTVFFDTLGNEITKSIFMKNWRHIK